MAGYKPYPEYKDSGVEWLGEVPRHWTNVPLKHLAIFTNGCVFKPNTWSDDGVPIIRIENLNGGDNFNCYDGDIEPRYHISKGALLFGWSGNRGTSFGPYLWPREGLYFLNQHIFKVQELNCGRAWLYWCLKAVTAHVEEQAHGIIGMVHVTKGELGCIKAAIPSPPEQQTIARFLDHKTAQIDALIAKKQTLLEKLAEKRTALISHAVTKGLNPNAKMKDSGVEWLGQVPVHWKVVRLRFVVSKIEQGWSPQCENQPADEEEWGVLKVGCVNGEHFDPLENKALPSDVVPRAQYEIKVGDILMSRANTKDLLGGAALVTEVRGKLILCDKLYRFIPSEEISNKYLVRILRSSLSRFQYEREATGASGSMQNIGQDTVKNLVFALPPVEEQLVLEKKLEKISSQVEAAECLAKEAIGKLKEYRAALITQVVTGKIDVRSIKVPKTTAKGQAA